MAKLSRLSICGIRSFGPRDDDVQDIKFTSPVTLILGENGCGKTTIIESLRYACTGDYPEGTSSGKGFLQDPQLSNSGTIKGFVKLRLTDLKGNTVIINRGAKLERLHTGKLRCSKMDSTIRTSTNEGEEATLSGRCADIGEQVYLLMGISKPIINNVIFCHQEHSLWPLDEDSQVKKKFDEIFDATKYNKCIDDFRKFFKDEKSKLKNLKDLLFYKKEKKEFVEKKRANLNEEEDNLSKIITSIEDKEKENTPISNEIQKICELENTLGQLQAKLATKETEKKAISENRQLILTKLEDEFSGSNEELNDAIENFERNKQKNNSKIKNTEVEIKQAEDKISGVNSEIQKLQVRIGQLETEKKQQEERISDRNKQINILAKQLDMRVEFNDENDIKVTMDSISDAIKKNGINLDNERKINQLDEKNQQVNIDGHRENIAKIEQERDLNLDKIKEIQNKQRDTNSQLKQLEVSDDKLKNMNNKICEIDREIKFLLESFDPNEIERRIKNTRNEIENLENDLGSMEKDYSILQKNYVTEENITTRTSDLKKKEIEMYEKKTCHFQNFKLLFDEVPEKDFKVAVEKCAKENTIELDEIKLKIDGEKQKITYCEANIHTSEEKLKTYETKVSEINQKVEEIAENEPFDKVCLDLEKDIEKLQKFRGQLSSAKIIYEKFVKDFQSEKPCCPVCETDFTDKKSIASKIVAKIKQQIEDIPQELERKENELKKKQELFSQAQQLKPLYEEAKELKESAIPKLKTEINNNKNVLREAENNLRQFNEKIEKPKQLIEVANKIMGDVTLIDKCTLDIHSYKKEIDNLKLKLIPLSSNRSREQVERAIKVCREDLSEKRKSCDADSKRLENNRNEYQELRDQKTETERDKLNLEKSMHGKPQLLEQLTGLEEDDLRLESEIERIRKELIPLREILNTTKQNLELCKTENETKYKKNMEEYNQIKGAFESLIKNQNSIETFAKKKIEDQLVSVLDNYRKCKHEEESLKTDNQVLIEELMELKENQAKAETNKRNLEDNVEIRKKAKEIENLERSIKSLKDEMGAYNHVTLQKTKQQLQIQLMALIKEINNMKGQKEQLEKKIEADKADLEKPENKGAYNLYRRALYELEAKTRSILDAEIYSVRLEKAIIQFHTEKMANINRTIRELWRSVYRGNDIDYIQIRTEQPETSASARRAYNYRVVQIKNDVEIDMRGRCSAGQKVLACLLIRMALALTFSHNCGILALDEPTTNLDRENVHSLCETLADMIQSRRAEKNFQLLIITHDEEFIKSLSQSENIDHCLKVARNRYGNTIISREYIS